MGGAWNIVDLDVELVQTSCGFGVPLFEYVDQRPHMGSWAAARSDEVISAYQQQKNRVSIDGLPTGLPTP